MPAYKKYLPLIGLLLTATLAGCGSSSSSPQQLPNTGGSQGEVINETYQQGVHASQLDFEGSCFACHANEGSELLKTIAGSGSPEYNLCVSCHSDSAETIADFPATHAAFIADFAATKNACSQCHDPHAGTKFAQVNAAAITTQWTLSGHGDAASFSFTYGGFGADCLTCHSGSVFAQTIAGSSDIDTSGGGQVIGCVACHDLTARDSVGNFAPGPIRSIPEVTFPSGAVASLGPESNLCMKCHQGRSSTPTVDARIADGNLSFANIHYYAAAATLFGSEVQGGYEYPGRTYAGRNTFVVHGLLGEPELITCTGCHMGDTATHSFEVALERCTNCHSGDSFPELADQPRFNFERIAALKDQLLTVLGDSGVTRVLDGDSNHIHPYFENIGTAAQLKAAYNWQVADKEPAGYIHNGLYLRQLLFDSIVDMGATPLFANP